MRGVMVMVVGGVEGEEVMEGEVGGLEVVVLGEEEEVEVDSGVVGR